MRTVQLSTLQSRLTPPLCTLQTGGGETMVRWPITWYGYALLLSVRCLVGEEAALRGALEPSPRLRELGGLARLLGAERADLDLLLLVRVLRPGK
jgi:hypothetical protein